MRKLFFNTVLCYWPKLTGAKSADPHHQATYLTLPLFLVGHDVGYYGPPFFPVGSNFCASLYVHSCISGDVSQPSASLPSSTAFAIYHAFCDYTL